MSEKIKYKFPTGPEVTGTIDEIEKVAKALGHKVDYTVIGKIPRGYYPSESKGLTKISEMSDFHLRRALLKRGKDYLASVFNVEDNISTFLHKFTCLTNDTIVEDLYYELSKRA